MPKMTAPLVELKSFSVSCASQGEDIIPRVPTGNARYSAQAQQHLFRHVQAVIRNDLPQRGSLPLFAGNSDETTCDWSAYHLPRSILPTDSGFHEPLIFLKCFNQE
jgi:hypothetical protein